MAKPRTMDDDATIKRSCDTIRRKWADPSLRIANSEMMLATSIISVSTEDMDSIRPHLENLAQKRNAAKKAIKDFKNTLITCREKIGNARNTQKWITEDQNKEVSLNLVSEAIGMDIDEVIRRLLRSLDRNTYRYLAGIKGSECPLCGAKQ